MVAEFGRIPLPNPRSSCLPGEKTGLEKEAGRQAQPGQTQVTVRIRGRAEVRIKLTDPTRLQREVGGTEFCEPLQSNFQFTDGQHDIAAVCGVRCRGRVLKARD